MTAIELSASLRVTGRAGELCAAVVGQDVEQDEGGRVVIARRVARDRVISTVDPDARHGRKSSAHGFDGYKGHLAIDPESELITQKTVTVGNVADGDVAEELITDLLEDAGEHDVADDPAAEEGGGETPTVYGDSAYGSGAFQEVLEEHGIESRCRTQRATAPHHRFSKEWFTVDLERESVTCPAEVTVPIRRASDGSGTAYFRGACSPCPLRAQCTTSPAGRTVQVGVHEASLAAARARQETPGWLSGYRTVRSIVERKVAHTTRRRHGGASPVSGAVSRSTRPQPARRCRQPGAAGDAGAALHTHPVGGGSALVGETEAGALRESLHPGSRSRVDAGPAHPCGRRPPARADPTLHSPRARTAAAETRVWNQRPRAAAAPTDCPRSELGRRGDAGLACDQAFTETSGCVPQG